MEQEAAGEQLRVFLPKGPESSRVGVSRIRRGLDRDRQQPTIGLDDEVDLQIGRRSPVQYLRGRDPAVAPHQQVDQHERLQVCSGRGFGAAQPQRERRVAPVELRSPDQPLGAIDRIGRQADELEGGLEQVEVALHRLARFEAAGVSVINPWEAWSTRFPQAAAGYRPREGRARRAAHRLPSVATS